MDKAIDFLDPIDTDVPKGGEEIMNRTGKTEVLERETMLLQIKDIEETNKDCLKSKGLVHEQVMVKSDSIAYKKIESELLADDACRKFSFKNFATSHKHAVVKVIFPFRMSVHPPRLSFIDFFLYMHLQCHELKK